MWQALGIWKISYEKDPKSGLKWHAICNFGHMSTENPVRPRKIKICGSEAMELYASAQTGRTKQNLRAKLGPERI